MTNYIITEDEQPAQRNKLFRLAKNTRNL